MDCDIAIIGGPVGATAAARWAAGTGRRGRARPASTTPSDHRRSEVMRCLQFAASARNGAHVRPHPGTRYLGVDGSTIKQTDHPASLPARLAGWHPFHSRNSGRCCANVARHGNWACSRMSSSTLPTWATASASRSGIWRRRRPARSKRDISWPVTAPTASCAESSGSAMKTSPSTSGGSSWMRGSGGPRRCPR